MRKVFIAVVIFSMCINTLKAQSLYMYLGGGAGYDLFMRNKQVTTNKLDNRILISPQFIIGMRYYTAQKFNVMLDATIGLSRFNMPTEYRSERYYYEQVRSIITVGSGFYIQVDETQSFMPYLQLGTAFYEFHSMAQKVNTGYMGISRDYDSRHFVAVVGAGFEYSFGMQRRVHSAINVRALYTPTDIFPKPVKYDMYGIYDNGTYALQGKLLQFLITYQFNIPLKREQYY